MVETVERGGGSLELLAAGRMLAGADLLANPAGVSQAMGHDPTVHHMRLGVHFACSPLALIIGAAAHFLEYKMMD
jgi:hypothetical protein